MGKQVALLPAVSQEEFEAMTNEERWKAVAQDVLAQLRIRRIVPKAGTWCETLDAANARFSRETLVGEQAPRCAACALGATFLAAVRLGNRFDRTVNYINRDAYPLDGLLDRETQDLVEFAFEGGWGEISEYDLASDYGWRWDECEELRARFFAAHEDDASRLHAIMQAIATDGPAAMRPKRAEVAA